MNYSYHEREFGREIPDDLVSEEEMVALGLTGNKDTRETSESSQTETGLESLHERVYQMLPNATEEQLKSIINILEK